MKTLLPLVAALSTLTMAAAPATAAPTLGDVVTCTAHGLNCSSGSAVLGKGNEFTGNFGGMPILGFDFADGMLRVSNVSAFSYGVVADMKLTFGDLADPFTSVSLVSSSGFLNLSDANFSVADGALTFASPFFSAAQDATMTLRVGSAAAVPEPAAWAMMILGLGLMGVALRRGRTTATNAAA